MIQNNIREYSQWFPGEQNILADSLSRDFNLNDTTLTKLFRKLFSTQLPPQFEIVSLPQEINSWLYSWLLAMPDSLQQPKEHHTSKIELGFDGQNSFTQLIFPAIFSSTQSNPNTESPLFLHSPIQSGEQITLDPRFQNWLATRSEIPSTMWLRPSATINSQTRD